MLPNISLNADARRRPLRVQTPVARRSCARLDLTLGGSMALGRLT